MILSSDYHTHTKYSHGKGTIIENAIVAKQKGLKQIAISDHGFSHPAFGLREKRLDSYVKDCRFATQQTGVKVLVGIESNVTSIDGDVDLKPKLYDKFDIFLAGVHKFILYKPNSVFSFSIPNLTLSTLKVDKFPKSLIARNTKTIINVVKNNPIDILTHINFCCPVDVLEVAKVCSDYGTYVELNAKKTHISEEQLYQMSKTDVKFVINSDAHTPDRVGEISLVEKLLSNVKIDEDRIANINGKIPVFRFNAFKEGKWTIHKL